MRLSKRPLVEASRNILQPPATDPANSALHLSFPPDGRQKCCWDRGPGPWPKKPTPASGLRKYRFPCFRDRAERSRKDRRHPFHTRERSSMGSAESCSIAARDPYMTYTSPPHSASSQPE